jgi:hypothetical protein
MTRHIFPRHIFLSTALLLPLIPGCSHRTPTDSDLFNQPAAISTSKLPFNPLSWRIITTGIDSQQHTMSALYGNDPAIASARSSHPTYPDGAVLSLVTWYQREDPHWFGGRIPDKVQSIEFVTVGSKDPATSYQRYEGPDLHQAALQDSDAAARKMIILSQRASVMP